MDTDHTRGSCRCCYRCRSFRWRKGNISKGSWRGKEKVITFSTSPFHFWRSFKQEAQWFPWEMLLRCQQPQLSPQEWAGESCMAKVALRGRVWSSACQQLQPGEMRDKSQGTAQEASLSVHPGKLMRPQPPALEFTLYKPKDLLEQMEYFSPVFFMMENIVSSEICFIWRKKGFCCNIEIFRKIPIHLSF